MNSSSISKDIEKDPNQKNSKYDLRKISSKYIIKHIFDFLDQRILLKTVKYNKKFQNELNLSLNDYKVYSQIEIDIIPVDYDEFEEKGRIINFNNEEEAKYFHIYYNDNIKREINREKKNFI